MSLIGRRRYTERSPSMPVVCQKEKSSIGIQVDMSAIPITLSTTAERTRNEKTICSIARESLISYDGNALTRVIRHNCSIDRGRQNNCWTRCHSNAASTITVWRSACLFFFIARIKIHETRDRPRTDFTSRSISHRAPT